MFNITRKKILFTIITLVLLLCAAGGTYYIFHTTKNSDATKALEEESYTVPPLTKKYTNTSHNFSLNMPEDFSARESTVDGKDSIVFENTQGQGIQILISPYDDINVLTVEMIQEAIPELTISDSQPVNIGASHTGVAFKSDNDAFGGSSREVWFVFKGKLYQISTYKKFDELLKSMVGTWSFY